MGLINLLNDEVENFKFYLSKGYTGDGDKPGMKSLKFGKDRPGGGDSGQPYIKNPILDNIVPESEDFLLRGGLNAPTDAAEDVVRLTKYMFDLKSPSGLLFTAKQNLLSRVSPKTEASKGAGYAGGALNGGVYTPLSTLAQAGVGFAGIHLNKQGIDPTGLINALSIKKYGEILKTQTADENRLVNILLYSRKNLNGVKGYDINQGQDVITYNGGPGSVLGIGKTHIRYADQRTGINNPISDSDPKYFYKGGIKLHKEDENNIILGINETGTPIITYGLGASRKQGLDDLKIGITENGTYNVSTINGNPYNYILKYSTLSKDSKGLILSGSNGYQIGLPRPETKVNYNNLLGASIQQGLDDTQTGIDPTTGTNFNLYGPTRDNSTLSKYNPTNSPLSGSDGYQANKLFKTPTQQSDSTYKSQIEGKLQTYGRELLSDSTFIAGNTWRATSPGPGGTIPEYSSKNSLSVNKEASSEKNDNSKFEIINRPETEGYLANLDKNSGVAFINGTYTYFNNETSEGYGRGIAGDFRKVTRKKRGFDNENNSYDYITNDKADWSKTIDQIYYRSSDKRTSNSIENIFEDLIPFKIGIINPTNPTAPPPTGSTTLQFRAYIDNLSDSYNSDWKSQTYMGRAEKFYKYDSFDRSISLGFTIVADSETNLNIMYQQLNTLAASLAPTYTTSGYMTGNLHRLTIGNYVKDQVGIMSGLTYEIMDESPWEIKEESQLPLYIKVTGIKFTPIHNFRPESQFNRVHPYIKQ